MSLTKEITVRYALIAAFAASALAIRELTWLATDYVTVGHGLHPAAAVLGGVVLTVIGVLCLRLALSRD